MQNDHTDIIVQNLRMYQSDFKGIITFWCRDVFILLLLVKDEICFLLLLEDDKKTILSVFYCVLSQKLVYGWKYFF